MILHILRDGGDIKDGLRGLYEQSTKNRKTGQHSNVGSGSYIHIYIHAYKIKIIIFFLKNIAILTRGKITWCHGGDGGTKNRTSETLGMVQ